MTSPASSSNSTASTTTPRSTPITRAHTLFDCTPFALALFPALDSRKAKPGNGVHPRMLSYSPTERDEEPEFGGGRRTRGPPPADRESTARQRRTAPHRVGSDAGTCRL